MSLNLYELEQVIKVKMTEGHIPGFAMAIVQDQAIIYASGFGYTAVDHGERGLPVTPQTLFRIGSTTKALTGVALMRLVEAGKLDLDIPIKNYIPWLTFSEPGAEEIITLRMLMSHTSGLPTEWEYPGQRDPSGLETYVREVIPQFPLVAPPGKAFSYSGVGISLAGYIAEVVSSMNYTQLMQELVFDPLKMKRTTFDPTVAMTYPMAQSHDLSEDGILTIQHHYLDNVGQYPESYANSTVLDLANFCMMQLNQGCFGDEQILSPATIAEMQQVQADQYTFDGAGYGLTLSINQHKGVRLVGHGGLMGTHFTLLDMVPNSGIAIIALGNRPYPYFWGLFMKEVLDQILDLPAEYPKPKAVDPDKSRWEKYVGSYLGNWTGLSVIRVYEDRLVLDWNGETIPLNSLKDHLYFGQKPSSEELVSVGFINEEIGKTQYIMLNTDLCNRIEFDKPPISNIDAWTIYTGKYQGDFFIMTTELEGDRFVIHSKDLGGRWNLIPLGGAKFACQNGIIEFQEDQDGTVNSFKLADLLTLTRIGEDL